MRRGKFLIFSLLALGASAASAQPYVRVHNDVIDVRHATAASGPAGGVPENVPCTATPVGFNVAPYAWHSQPVPGGGTLGPLAFANPAIINAGGKIAFIANVAGAARNQGVFVSDGVTLQPIAMGCGGGGGSGNHGTCGDPSPIGGTFAGFFGGTVFAPPINDDGDVLFFVDVIGGSSTRGLFLYRAATQAIVKVAAIGDPSPIGGTLTEIGPGSMNNSRQIVFLARNSGNGNVNILKWTNGVVTKHVAVGDPTPVGGTFSLLAGESLGYQDGTFIPSGAVPAINESGQVAFFGIVQGGTAERGLFVTTGATHAIYLRRFAPTPMGGTYDNFFAPLLNNAGQIAVFADINLGGGNFTSAWIVGGPTTFRKALAFLDPIQTGDCYGMAVSRNPIRALDDCGNLLVWCDERLPDLTMREALLISPASGPLIIVAQRFDPSPLGGFYGSMQPWPAMNNHLRGMLSTGLPGTPGIFNAHHVFSGLVRGDVDGDGDIDADDALRFVEVLLELDFDPGRRARSDMNADGTPDGIDVQPFVAAVLAP